MARKNRTPKTAAQTETPVAPVAVAPVVATETETPKVRKSVVPASYKKAYGSAGNNGDEVAVALAGKDNAQLRALAAEHGIEWKWDHLNPGMQRMNLGNRLRKVLRDRAEAAAKEEATKAA